MSLSSIRDIALVVLAVEGFVIGLLLLALAYGAMWVMRKLRRWLEENISRGVELLRKFRGKVEETTARVTEPIITIESSVAAIRGTFRYVRNRLSRGGGNYA